MAYLGEFSGQFSIKSALLQYNNSVKYYLMIAWCGSSDLMAIVQAFTRRDSIDELTELMNYRLSCCVKDNFP